MGFFSREAKTQVVRKNEKKPVSGSDPVLLFPDEHAAANLNQLQLEKENYLQSGGADKAAEIQLEIDRIDRKLRQGETPS